MKTGLTLAIALVFFGVTSAQDMRCEWPVMRALVGPEDAIYLRGEGVLASGSTTVVLPAGFETMASASGHTVQVTCIDGYSPLSVSRVSGGRFSVRTLPAGNPQQAFFWEVKAKCAAAPPSGLRK